MRDGVSTHLSLLLTSAPAEEFALIHFEVGSEGRNEAHSARARGSSSSPFRLGWRCSRTGAVIVHLKYSAHCARLLARPRYALVAKLCGATVLIKVHGGALHRGFAADIAC